MPKKKVTNKDLNNSATQLARALENLKEGLQIKVKLEQQREELLKKGMDKFKTSGETDAEIIQKLEQIKRDIQRVSAEVDALTTSAQRLSEKYYNSFKYQASLFITTATDYIAQQGKKISAPLKKALEAVKKSAIKLLSKLVNKLIDKIAKDIPEGASSEEEVSDVELRKRRPTIYSPMPAEYERPTPPPKLTEALQQLKAHREGAIGVERLEGKPTVKWEHVTQHQAKVTDPLQKGKLETSKAIQRDKPPSNEKPKGPFKPTIKEGGKLVQARKIEPASAILQTMPHKAILHQASGQEQQAKNKKRSLPSTPNTEKEPANKKPKKQ